MIAVHGVDFSGAVDAGRKIWIASGTADAHALRVTACRPARALPGGAPVRKDALAALRAFIVAAGASAFGLDFPFAIPRPLVHAPTWEEFAATFARLYPRPELFRRHCLDTALRVAGKRELRRSCDGAARAPYAAYNWRLYRQTYYGIRCILAPLALEGLVCVRPMQDAVPGRPWLFEVCPAVTLKQLALSRPYKGRARDHHVARCAILEALGGHGLVVAADLRPVIVSDPEGDALDAVVAALAAWRAVQPPGDTAAMDSAAARLEGYIYA